MKKIVISSFTGSIFIVLFGAFHQKQGEIGQSNTPPQVKLMNPKNNTTINPGIMRYQFSISDKEDGSSAYSEIPDNQGILQVQYFESEAAIHSARRKTTEDGFYRLLKSDCLNCHAFKAKFVAPAFQEISKKYRQTDIPQVAQHIVKGSTGIWGAMAMPAHATLSLNEAENMVKWILENANRPDLVYLMGYKGLLDTKMVIPPGKEKGMLLFVASYLDKGSSTNADDRLTGRDTTIVMLP